MIVSTRVEPNYRAHGGVGWTMSRESIRFPLGIVKETQLGEVGC